MALLSRCSAYDSWGEMEQAAEERHIDGLCLATSDDRRSTGAIYLLGYVAEILIKLAYYRVRGLARNDPVAGELRDMRNRAQLLGSPWTGGQSRHQVQDLAYLLVYERRARGRALDPYFAQVLQGHAQTIAAHWSEVLRYRDVTATDGELADLYRSVDWLLVNSVLLWT
jgi:hypothetical protein